MAKLTIWVIDAAHSSVEFSTEVDRRDWGLEWNQALETGGVLVGHTLKVQVDVEAVQAEATGKSVA
jgi:polyisoprenoid-binding protein YceI